MTNIKFQEEPALSRTSLKRYSKIGILVDENSKKFCYEIFKGKLPPHSLIEVPAGEQHKNLATCQSIWQRLTEFGFDRHSLLIVIGGGVLGDMGGFCAATFKRGIDFMLLPTTLLAQVDASIGGKLAIDFGVYKNHIGLFHEPVTTQIVTRFLKTLPEREVRSGFAEVIKHCLIADKKMWDSISRRSLAQQNWKKLVPHSVAIKARVVQKDPREKGLRKTLNLGHTIGHALEGYFLNSRARLFHGEAIAAGMILEAFVSTHKGMLPKAQLTSITKYILSVFGKIDLGEPEKWLPLIRQDKKNKGNTTLMALPRQIGKAVWDIPVSENEIRAAVDYYRSYQT